MSLPGPIPKISFEELCREARVPERTVRYYVHEGLLPPSEGSGRAANYNQDHVLRLVATRYLNKALGQSLAQIKEAFKTVTRQQLEVYYQEAQTRFFDYERAASKGITDLSSGSPGSSALDYLQKVRAAQGNRPGGKSLNPSPPPDLPRLSQNHDEAQADRSSTHKYENPAQPSQRQHAYPFPKVPGETWQRVVLAPEVELHFKNLSPTDERFEKITSLLEQAKKIFAV